MSERILPYVTPEVIGCPNVVAKNYILQAATELCQRGHVWQYDHPAISVTGGATTALMVQMYPPTGATVAKILDAIYGDIPLEEAGLEKLKKKFVNWRTETGEPSYHYLRPGDVVALVPGPLNSDTLGLTLAMQPDGSTTTLPDALVAGYTLTIAAGAKYYLMMMPGQKWTNPELANFYKEQFYDGIGVANFESGGPIEVEPCV